MDATVVELLKDKIDNVDKKVDRIETKVDQMIEFKWQIVGGSIVCSAVVGIILQIILSMVGGQ